MEEPGQPLLITVNELANQLGISVRTVWRLISSGEMVKPVRFGKNVRWRFDEIRQWIAAGCPRLGKEAT
jgi:excisionase family DNA binding protein